MRELIKFYFFDCTQVKLREELQNVLLMVFQRKRRVYQPLLFNNKKESMDIGDEFLLTCKRNYFDKVTPSNTGSRLEEGYKKLVNIANEYFRHNEYERFAGFFQEGQYFIPLWAAHLILEYGSANHEMVLAALNIIKDYSDNPLAQDVVQEERQWLDANSDKYRSDLK